MNTFKFYIFKPYTKEAIKASVNYRIPGNFEEVEATPVYPLGIGNFLDERLDEAYITIYNSSTEHYKAKTICKVEIYEGEKVAATKFYIIGNDNSIELPVGSGKYKHDLFLIEPTKLLEGVVCQSLTFTNAFTAPQYPLVSLKLPANQLNGPANYLMEQTINNGWRLTVPSKIHYDQFSLPTLKTVADEIISFWKQSPNTNTELGVLVNGTEQFLTNIPSDISEEIGGTQSKILAVNGLYNTKTITNINTPCDIQKASSANEANTYDVTYTLCFFQPGPNSYFYVQFSFNVEFTSYYQTKPYTITTMTQRCLELAKPLCKNESHQIWTPMISFNGVAYQSDSGAFGNPDYNNGSQSSIYDQQIATELTLTQGTLREQLKTIGNLIHSEPRVVVLDTGKGIEGEYNTTIGFDIKYDPYDKGTNANISKKPYVYKALNQSINEYCDSVRSTAKNLVNLLDYGQGTFVDPIASKNKLYDPAEFKTVRSETINMRITASNGICATSLPIYDIVKVECGIVSQDSWERWATKYEWGSNSKVFDGKPVDITPYVFEKSAYDTLDNFSRTGKALAIYYTRGQKNLGGLFFKRSQVSINEAYGEYAIANILNMIGGQSIGFDDVVKAVFKVTYIPMYNVAVSHGKQNFSVDELFEPSYTIPYNQSENIIEARFYGENIKGAAARLGNVEQERTYIFDKLSDIPKNGQMIDGYTICASNTQMLPTHYKTTLALSKDFNRINQYVGVSQNKRTFEISEREAYERTVVMNAKVVISNESYSTPRYTLRTYAEYFRDLITNTNYSARQICNVVARGKKKNGDPLQAVILPVVSSSFGNVISFSWEYKDNYSAGEKVAYYSEGSVSGYWGKDVPYCDEYGRIFSYDFALLWQGIFTNSNLIDLSGLSLNTPEITNTQFDTLYAKGAIIANNLLLRKDSREKLTFNAQFEFVTDDPDLIIGSGLASCSDLTSYAPRQQTKLYLVKGDIGKFANNISDLNYIECHIIDIKKSILSNNGDNGIYIDFCNICDGTKDTPIYKRPEYAEYTSWAIARDLTSDEKTYIDENGVEMDITERVGGEILLASNRIPYVNVTDPGSYETEYRPHSQYPLYFKITS